MLDPVLNAAGKRGRKHADDLRRVVDAMFYIAQTVCQWRYLPESFGPWTRVWSQFRRWTRNDSWARALTVLHSAAREAAGHAEETPSMIVIDAGSAGSPNVSYASSMPVLLAMGFGTQLLGWDAEFCRPLAATGRHVIRYDNRDCGLSTKHDDSPVDLTELIGALTAGEFDRARTMAPYTLRDMAVDGISLLDALGIDRAHVGGSSMGGMSAQKIAIEFPDRVLSLTSMSSSTGEPEYGQPTPEAQQVLLSPRPADRDGYIAAAERDLVWASRRHRDPAAQRALAAASYDRSYYPAGIPRQLAAMILDGSRAGRYGWGRCGRGGGAQLCPGRWTVAGAESV